jgi:hypothetical protein
MVEPEQGEVMQYDNARIKPTDDEKPFVFSITAACPGRCIRRRISLPMTDEGAIVIIEKLTRPIRQARINRIRKEEP